MADIRPRLVITGESISPGMALGKAYSYRDINLVVLEQKQFPVENLAEENDRLSAAIHKSMEQLYRIRKSRTHTGSDQIQAIFEVQLSLLQDKQFLGEIWGDVQTRKLNLEHVIASRIRTVGESFGSMGNEYIRSKFSDIQDAYHRILRNLLEIDHVRTNTLLRIDSPVILVSERLLPSDIALIDPGAILGVVLEEVSSSSHAAIMLKALGIPTAGNVRGAASLIHSGNPVFIDAIEGRVVVFPGENDELEWKTHVRKMRKELSPVPHLHRRQRTTRDGQNVFVEANAGSTLEVQQAAHFFADGVGLLRTELYYMSRTTPPSTDEESAFLGEILAQMPEHPVTVRLLDLGADKKLPYLPMAREDDPQLGTRGIRYLLQNPDLLTNQVQAVLTAGAPDRTRILLPFIGVAEDVIRARELITAACRSRGAAKKVPPVGIMIEIPSAALAIESLIEYADFISIGTNDLVQYLFAASREDPDLESYRQVRHPLVLRLIDGVVRCAKAHKKPVAVCGDAAMDPVMLMLMVGLGIRNFSVSARQVSLVSGLLEKISARTAKAQAEKALACVTAEEVAANILFKG